MTMQRVVVMKRLKDGSGRCCIHYLVRDDSGPITMLDCEIVAMPYKVGGRARIACNKEQNTVTPQERGQEVFQCLRSDDVRAVTCPDCLATKEAKDMLAHYAEMEDVQHSPEILELVHRSMADIQKLAASV